MITTDFLKSCTEEEQGILHLILLSSLNGCNYVPSFECVKFLRRNVLIKIFPSIKKQIKEEHLSILENLEKKITAEI